MRPPTATTAQALGPTPSAPVLAPLEGIRAAEGAVPAVWETQSAVTIVASVDDAGVAGLRALLGEMADDVAGNRIVPLGNLGGTHFARFFITEAVDSPDGHRIPTHLVYMSDFDGSPEAHLAHLVDVAAEGIDRLYGHCAGYPRGDLVAPGERLEYLRRHTVSTGVNYVNTIGRTVGQVIGEAALYEAIEDFLDRRRAELQSSDARTVRGSIQEFLQVTPELRWALTPAPGPPLSYRLRELALFVGPLVLALVLLPILLPAVVLWLLALRLRESRDPAPRLRPDPARVTELRALEDHGAQNQFTALGFVKPGWLRGITAQVIMQLIGFGARHIFNHGSLAGVTTIHFARWVPLDGRARIVFCSNYDGSTESYMDDFIDKVAWGLNAVFSNGADYPPTRWLILGGARDEERFKGYLRTRQLPTQVWFAAYDRVSALNIGTHARVRAGLAGEMDEAAAQAWLRLL